MEVLHNHPIKPKTFFSFDGGGVRGLIILKILIEIEKITGRAIADLVDFLTGNSVGAIIAATLLVPKEKGSREPKYTAAKVYDFFKANVELLFPQNGWFAGLTSLFTSKYSGEDYNKFLTEFFEDMTANDALKDFLFPASENSHGGEAWWFTKEKIIKGIHSNSPPISPEAAKHIPMKDILRASGSPPTYFPMVTMSVEGKDFAFEDGVFVANNTTSFAITCNLETPLFVGHFGTGIPPRTDTTPHPYFQGGLYWITHGIGFSMNVNTDQANLSTDIAMAEISKNGAHAYYNFNPEISAAETNLDDSSPENIEKLEQITEKFIIEHQSELIAFCNHLVNTKVKKGYCNLF